MCIYSNFRLWIVSIGVTLMATTVAMAESEFRGNRARFNISASGLCSPRFLAEKGLRPSRYRPKIVFNSRKMRIEPPNPVIPGCFRLIAENVQILAPMRDLVGEFEIRLGGVPDPKIPPIPCGKRVDESPECGCSNITKNNCMFCDFCEKMRRQVKDLTINRQKTRLFNPSGNNQKCQCEAITRGSYDINTEICTPSLEEMKQHIPPGLQNEILENEGELSTFITVYLYDLPVRRFQGVLSELGRKVMLQRRIENTVACYLLGINVKINGAAAKQPKVSQSNDRMHRFNRDQVLRRQRVRSGRVG